MNTFLNSNAIFNQFNQNLSFQSSLQFRTNKKMKVFKKQGKQTQKVEKYLSKPLNSLNILLTSHSPFKMHQENQKCNMSMLNEFFTIKKKLRSKSKTLKKQVELNVFNQKKNRILNFSSKNKSQENLLKEKLKQQQSIKQKIIEIKTPTKKQKNYFFSVNDFVKTTKKYQDILDEESEAKQKQISQSAYLAIEKYHLKENISMVQSIIFNQKKAVQLSDLHIIKPIGKGQYGRVYLAIHKVTYFVFALKIICKQKVKINNYQEQILRQLKIHSNLNHPNIIPMYGFFDDQKNIYVIMEYCIDKNLNNFTKKKQCLRMQQAELSQLALQLTDGIQYLHRRNIIHRDIKPENIMLNYGIPKICDFGWSIYKHSADLTKTRSGTPLYYSPEVVKGQSYDYKVDIWALGMIIYQCLVGKTPFKVYTQNQLNRIVDNPVQFPNYVEINDPTKQTIYKLLQKDPVKRLTLEQFRNSQLIIKNKTKNHENKYYLDLFFALRE